MFETIIYLSSTIIIAIASYKAGHFIGDVNGYLNGWSDCKGYHGYTETVSEAAERLEADGYLECGVRKERMN